jgi:hypothetical protein
MIRQIIIPTQKTFTLELPEEFMGKEVEIIAFEVNTTSEKDSEPEYKTVEELKKALEPFLIDMKDYKFNRDEANDYD